MHLEIHPTVTVQYMPTMSTELVYLQEEALLELDAQIEASGRDDRGAYLVLNRTVMYPQGGGQPSDRGRIQTEGDEFSVTFVGFVEGIVRHYGSCDSAPSEVGAPVRMMVEPQRRLLNAQAHTAGHLVGNIVEDVRADLVAIKGYHFPDGPYVEFRGVKPSDAGELLAEANRRISAAIAADLPVEAKVYDLHSLVELCPHVPENLPAGKPLRAVRIGDYPPIPCGGTHLSSLSYLTSAVATKIKSRKGNCKVSYSSG